MVMAVVEVNVTPVFFFYCNSGRISEVERNERESTDGCMVSVFIKTKVDLLSKRDDQD